MNEHPYKTFAVVPEEGSPERNQLLKDCAEEMDKMTGCEKGLDYWLNRLMSMQHGRTCRVIEEWGKMCYM